MKKVIRSRNNIAQGYMETNKAKGTQVLYTDKQNGHGGIGFVAETMRSLDYDKRKYIEDLGELE